MALTLPPSVIPYLSNDATIASYWMTTFQLVYAELISNEFRHTMEVARRRAAEAGLDDDEPPDDEEVASRPLPRIDDDPNGPVGVLVPFDLEQCGRIAAQAANGALDLIGRMAETTGRVVSQRARGRREKTSADEAYEERVRGRRPLRKPNRQPQDEPESPWEDGDGEE